MSSAPHTAPGSVSDLSAPRLRARLRPLASALAGAALAVAAVARPADAQFVPSPSGLIQATGYTFPTGGGATLVCEGSQYVWTPTSFGPFSCSTGRVQSTHWASVVPPSVFDPADPANWQLMKLGARIEVQPEVRSVEEFDVDQANGITAERVQVLSYANFIDYLRLSTASASINSLQLTFDVTGTFALDPLLGGTDIQLVYAQYMSAWRGELQNDGTWGGYQPATGGELSFQRSLQNGQLLDNVSLAFGLPTASAFSYTIRTGNGCSGTCFDLTLGSAFFLGATDNSVIEFASVMMAYANMSDLYYAEIPYGERPVAIGDVDFANTLRLTGLRALDANGDDITSRSGLAFWSVAPGQYVPPPPTVPEPATLTLLAMGVGGIGVVRRMRRV